MILADNETKVDLLNNEAIAATIIEMLRERPDTPVTIGVHGDWGAGKSSILEMIGAGLVDDKSILCLKVNGWRFQGFEDAKIALIESIVTGLLEMRPALTKTTDAVKDLLKRVDVLKAVKAVGGLALLAATTPVAGLAVAALGAQGLPSAIKPGEGSKNVPEEIGAFRRAFDALLDKAEISQLVILIDDLDRCLPDTAIETLEAVRLFVFTKRTAFVVAADEAMIEYAVRKHFPELPDTTGPRDYARNYLEKLIQVPVRIPVLGETETRIYVTLLLIGAELGETDEAYIALIQAARDHLKRPWESTGLDAATVNTALGGKADRANNALTLSDQIGPLLASGTKGNPRQIKRFLNALLLRQRTAAARGFGDDVKLPTLAKLMLAELFIPRLFEQVAWSSARHPKGLCEDITGIEAALEGDSGVPDAKPTPKGPRKPAGTGKEVSKSEAVTGPDENTVVSEWMGSEPIRTWARLKPALAGVDLRPYLFVAKDRKDYFGAASVLGRLAAVVERLLGPKLSVQALDSELKQLAIPEAAQVFEAVRGRIMGGDVFNTQPDGIDGLTVLVKAHQTLQPQLLDLLEAIPRDQCGAWAVKGWEGVITDAEMSVRFNRLLETWSGLTNNTILKTAAGAALKMRGGGR